MGRGGGGLGGGSISNYLLCSLKAVFGGSNCLFLSSLAYPWLVFAHDVVFEPPESPSGSQILKCQNQGFESRLGREHVGFIKATLKNPLLMRSTPSNLIVATVEDFSGKE